MSRTDKTAPWNIKALYYPSWVEEYHDHTNGVCELPERATYENLSYWGTVDSECRWTYSLEYLRSDMARCGCNMCGYDAYWSIPRRKRERIEAKRYCRDGWRDEY